MSFLSFQCWLAVGNDIFSFIFDKELDTLAVHNEHWFQKTFFYKIKILTSLINYKPLSNWRDKSIKLLTEKCDNNVCKKSSRFFSWNLFKILWFNFYLYKLESVYFQFKLKVINLKTFISKPILSECSSNA